MQLIGSDVRCCCVRADVVFSNCFVVCTLRTLHVSSSSFVRSINDSDELPLLLGGAGIKELVLEFAVDVEVELDVLLDVEGAVAVAVAAATLLAILLGAGAKVVLEVEVELEGAGAVVLELEEDDEDGAAAAPTLLTGLGALGPIKLAAAVAVAAAWCMVD